jgi:dihydrofolate reductase
VPALLHLALLAQAVSAGAKIVPGQYLGFGGSRPSPRPARWACREPDGASDVSDARHGTPHTDQEDGLMRKLFSYMVVTLDGFYEGPNQEFDWPNVDDTFNEYAISMMNDIDTLLFGRVTYEGMAAYWPTPAAVEGDPLVAPRMNGVPKIVYSATLGTADWQNTTLVTGDAVESVRELKQQPGKDLALFGSPHLTVSLLEQGLVDELRVMVNPILLGGGKSLFTGLKDRVRLQLKTATTFSSGNALLCYRPVAD